MKVKGNEGARLRKNPKVYPQEKRRRKGGRKGRKLPRRMGVYLCRRILGSQSKTILKEDRKENLRPFQLIL
jgi:hypothetical protein